MWRRPPARYLWEVRNPLRVSEHNRKGDTPMNSSNSSPSNADRVRAIYQAFGRQDVPAILEHLADDVQWDYAYPDHPVPWLRAGQGRAAGARFFQELSDRKSTRLNSSHANISYAVLCLKKKTYI